jgi:hypothetical protein
MMRITTVVFCWMLVPVLGFAQSQGEDFHRNNITVGVGAAIPLGSTATYLGTAPLVTVGYGYRFTRLFQADVGFQAAFGAANNQNPEITDFGPIQGGDHEFMIPLGGRVIIPNPFMRFEISAGGGTAYLHYSETIPQNGFVTSSCYSCTSRGGWGGYGLGNVSYFLDANHNFRVGTTFQFITAATNGQAVGNVPAIRTTDHWMNVFFGFGLSF